MVFKRGLAVVLVECHIILPPSNFGAVTCGVPSRTSRDRSSPYLLWDAQEDSLVTSAFGEFLEGVIMTIVQRADPYFNLSSDSNISHGYHSRIWRPKSAPPRGQGPRGPGKTESGWGDLGYGSKFPRWMEHFYGGSRHYSRPTSAVNREGGAGGDAEEDDEDEGDGLPTEGADAPRSVLRDHGRRGRPKPPSGPRPESTRPSMAQQQQEKKEMKEQSEPELLAPTFPPGAVGTRSPPSHRKTVLVYPQAMGDHGPTSLREHRYHPVEDENMETVQEAPMTPRGLPAELVDGLLGPNPEENLVPVEYRVALVQWLQKLEAQNSFAKQRLAALRVENEELKSLANSVEIQSPEASPGRSGVCARSLRVEAAKARVERLKAENIELEMRLEEAKEARERNFTRRD